MKKLAPLLVFLFGLWWWNHRPTTEPVSPEKTADAGKRVALEKTPEERPAPPQKPANPALVAAPPISTVSPQRPSSATAAVPRKEIVPYVLDGGLVVIQGDVVLGRPAAEDAPDEGVVALPPVRSWKSREIAYHIQPNFPQPERVLEALELFSGTVLKFVPSTDEEDVLVFEEGTGVCKSYVGRIGGKQPIWLPRDCGPAEVAHEIMHALGFVHEQNRDDRDEAITVNFDNIEEKHRANFEKLPPTYMTLSELSPFDFESLMIYPDNMFAKSSRPTMEPRARDRKIAPGRTLSPSDIERINEHFKSLR